jgi:hypothetical protein
MGINGRAGGKGKIMNELDKAIELLEQNYEEAEGKDWIESPIAYALYQTWKVFDEKKRRKTDDC